jgi:hypothetical protein
VHDCFDQKFSQLLVGFITYVMGLPASWRGKLAVNPNCSSLGYDTVQSYLNLGGENIKFHMFNFRIRVM